MSHSPGTQSFVIGSPVNVQFMVKKSKKYAATGRWGFADFNDGKRGDNALHETCYPWCLRNIVTTFRSLRTLMHSVCDQEVPIGSTAVALDHHT